MDSQNNTLTFRDYPLTEWLFGLLMLVTAVFTGIAAKGDWTITLISGIIGLFFFVFAAILVVQADRTRATLTIRRTSLLRRYVRAIPITDIAALQLEASPGSTSTCRIVVITKDNETIPFRTAYTSGLSAKTARVNSLRGFLGVGGADLPAGGIFKHASSLAQQALQEKQASLTGPEAEQHITEGVHWRVQTVAFGGTAFTRWFSPDQQSTSGFIFLAQKIAGHSLAVNGLLAGLGKLAYHQLIGMVGFGSEDTPGLDSAELLPSFDPQLDPHFSLFTSDPQAARQYFNPWSIAPLVDWATRYPLQPMQSSNELFGQLIVMVCPSGTYVACMGNMIPEAVQELTDLGVALVKGK